MRVAFDRLPPGFAPKIGRQDPECCRRQAIEPARLPYGARPRGLSFGAGLVGEPGHVGIIDIGQDQPLVAPEGIDVGGLALEIDVVFRVDLEMDRDRWVNGRQLRPDAAQRPSIRSRDRPAAQRPSGDGRPGSAPGRAWRLRWG